MKKIISLSIAFFAFFLSFNTSSLFAQSNENKEMGIAIIRSEDGKPETPKTAMKFPRYEKGTKAMYRYICEQMQYPETLKRQNTKGTTTVEFKVSANGSISDAEVFNTSGQEEFDKEALRIVNSFPKWKPAELDGKMLDMKVQVYIEFDCEKCPCKK